MYMYVCVSIGVSKKKNDHSYEKKNDHSYEKKNNQCFSMQMGGFISYKKLLQYITWNKICTLSTKEDWTYAKYKSLTKLTDVNWLKKCLQIYAIYILNL